MQLGHRTLQSCQSIVFIMALSLTEEKSPTPQLPENRSPEIPEALRPLRPAEIEEWEGWVELESEPAFFNIILRDLGVKNAKVQEVYSLDQALMDMMPKPVFGLVFLFQYHPMLDEREEQEDSEESPWFANQTIHNACATVALLNIVMNAPDVDLGPQLESFRESTRDLSTALRGHRLSSNEFIRNLSLENEARAPKAKKSRAKAAPKKRKPKNLDDYAFHFVAYVPWQGHVWELDGLQTKPRKLDDWTTVARPEIEARMLQYEDSQLQFSLQALCQNPLTVYGARIAEGLASLQAIETTARSRHATWQPLSALVSEEELPSFLADLRLDADTTERAFVPQAVHNRLEKVATDDEAQLLYEEVATETKATIGEYQAELLSMAEDEQRVKGRRKNYGPALHRWVTKLAEKGLLEGMISS
ncbi:Ubiquitin carboxyl-terminal hydrolase isozyme L5-like protein [Emericellopsis cladophorae]|uniref:Ubiquitin carboxyl-terminal hydrolase n=1 Tax=Emericellopsis cladophorae TaxID=2686198 RepID=A0A9P9XXF9_9HYPO|nr:Ubiquitin carboxyl-terminal hydrolase isozyme L5-like protein [Emericellopsis cladophorae]KAI6779638.1 Ubiquitin carboxyl-terminal hydrolase isozyme L5-like protein [Emericellopsis cladophorae]